MQYFVSAENTSYFYWQLELLIESFAMRGEQDSLLIALAENDSQKIGGFSSNLVRHRGKFLHQNEGRASGYPRLNRVAAIRCALSHGVLGFPFALIHSDMVMRNPIVDPGGEAPSVTVNNFEDYPMAEEEILKEEIRPGLEAAAVEQGVEYDDLPMVPFFSPPVVFNASFASIADVFFSRLQKNMTDILERRGADFPCEKAAWELTLAESARHCQVRGQFLSAPLLFDSEEASFIHYKTGIPPVFHKKFFRYEDGVYLAGRGPYETLMEHNPTVGTDFVQKVIKSYAGSRSKSFRSPRESRTSHADALG